MEPKKGFHLEKAYYYKHFIHNALSTPSFWLHKKRCCTTKK